MLFDFYVKLIFATIIFSVAYLLSCVLVRFNSKYRTVKSSKIRIALIFIICILYITRTYILIGLRVSRPGDTFAAIFFLILGVIEYLRMKQLEGKSDNLNKLKNVDEQQ